jgi:hypothetical protein
VVVRETNVEPQVRRSEIARRSLLRARLSEEVLAAGEFAQDKDPELLAASQEFVAANDQYPGMAYEPISIPLSWLFSKNSSGKVVGYRLKPWMVNSSINTDEVRNRVENLRCTGLIRYNSLDVKDGGWYSRVQLMELQPAKLVKRAIVPDSEENYMY